MRKISVRLLMVLSVFLFGHAWAANYSDPIDGVFHGVYSNAIYVEVPSLVSKSPVTGDQNGYLSFRFDPSTAFTNFHQLTDLKDGDPVRVEYKDDTTGKDKHPMAITITKLGPEVAVNPVSTTTDATGNVSSPTGAQIITTTTTTRVN